MDNMLRVPCWYKHAARVLPRPRQLLCQLRGCDPAEAGNDETSWRGAAAAAEAAAAAAEAAAVASDSSGGGPR